MSGLRHDPLLNLQVSRDRKKHSRGLTPRSSRVVEPRRTFSARVATVGLVLVVQYDYPGVGWTHGASESEGDHCMQFSTIGTGLLRDLTTVLYL